MKVITVKNKKEYIFEIDRDFFEKSQLSLEKNPISCEIKDTDQENGTKIILYEFREHIEHIDIEEFKYYIASQFGFYNRFNVVINGETCEPKEIPGEKVPVKILNPLLGTIEGYIIIADKTGDVKVPGVITTVRGRPVHGPSLFDINQGSHKYRVADKLIGYAEVTALDPLEKKEEIDEFTIITSRDGFNKSSKKYQAYKKIIETILIEICKKLEKKYREERKKKFANRMKNEIVGSPAGFLEFIENLNFENIDEDTQDYIFDFLKRITRLKEGIVIIDELKKASDEDIKKIAGLLQKWGLQEVALIVEIIKGRLEALEKFDEIVENDASLELKDIHPVLEKNLWLLDDNYRLYASNESIKKHVEKKILAKYKGKENKRPDLICKKLLEKVVIIELKRPSHKINEADLAQVLSYKKLIREHTPSAKYIDVFLLGNNYDESVRDKDLEKSNIFLYSFSEIVDSAKRRYDEILKILEPS